jgi:hypothetical protein
LSQRAPGEVHPVLPLLLTCALVGCGGSGGGGPTTPTPTTSLEFTPQGGGGANSVSLASAAGSNASTLFLDVRANGVSGFYGIAFDLSYPDNLLRWEAVAEGDFLSEGGSFSTSLQFAESPPGNLIIGLTRLGDVAGRTGSGTLLTLEFRAVGSGQGAFTYSNNDVFDRSGQPQDTVTWSAGSVQVVR